jgi:hypothetical protein
MHVDHLVNKALLRPIEPGVALTDHLPGVRSVYESSPAECSWPFPNQRILLDLQLRPRRCDLYRAGRAPTCGWSMSVRRAAPLLKHRSLARATAWSWSSLRCASR